MSTAVSCEDMQRRRRVGATSGSSDNSSGLLRGESRMIYRLTDKGEKGCKTGGFRVVGATLDFNCLEAMSDFRKRPREIRTDERVWRWGTVGMATITIPHIT